MRNGRLSAQGFSLLEVMIGLAIIASALLGIVAWQSLALRQASAADDQNMAMAQAEALLERFRANHSPQGFDQEFTYFQRQISNFLPQGRCEYQCTGAACTVAIYWQNHGLQTLALSTLL